MIETFRKLSEREQFAFWYGTQIGLEKLSEAANYSADGSDSNHTLREIGRSKFGIYNINKNVQKGRDFYDENS